MTTLVPVVRRLQERFGIAWARIVADRSMISANTIAAFEAAGMDYILGERERATREIYEEVMGMRAGRCRARCLSCARRARYTRGRLLMGACSTVDGTGALPAHAVYGIRIRN